MKKASISEAKNRLSALIHGLRGGAVLILDRGRPVARLETAGMEDGADLADLVRQGLVVPAKGKLSKELFIQPLPKLKRGFSVLQALLDDRREGR